MAASPSGEFVLPALGCDFAGTNAAFANLESGRHQQWRTVGTPLLAALELFCVLQESGIQIVRIRRKVRLAVTVRT